MTVAIAGCAAAPAAEPQAIDVPETVAIGGLPRPLSGTTVASVPAPTAPSTTPTTTAAPVRIDGPLAEAVGGRRLLLIGDTALAATTPRAGGIMCEVVSGFGWEVAVEAEPGRPLAFADEVLDAVGEDWDVVGLMFGHHVPDSVDDFERTLDELLDRLSARPVVLYTVAELGSEQRVVNEMLRARSRSRTNVVLLDWAEATAAEPDVLLDGGGPRPTEEGAGRLALFTAALLSRVPGDEPGACLDAVFTDDSAIVL